MEPKDVLPSKDITLLLTQEEAQFLYDVLCNIGGDPEKSRRRYANTIIEGLVANGIRWKHSFDIDEARRTIYFNYE